MGPCFISTEDRPCTAPLKPPVAHASCRDGESSSVLMKHGPIEAPGKGNLSRWVSLSSVLMKHGPIEAANGVRVSRLTAFKSSVLMKHGPIEARYRNADVAGLQTVFRADEARPH